MKRLTIKKRSRKASYQEEIRAELGRLLDKARIKWEARHAQAMSFEEPGQVYRNDS